MTEYFYCSPCTGIIEQDARHPNAVDGVGGAPVPGDSRSMQVGDGALTARGFLRIIKLFGLAPNLELVRLVSAWSSSSLRSSSGLAWRQNYPQQVRLEVSKPRAAPCSSICDKTPTATKQYALIWLFLCLMLKCTLPSRPQNLRFSKLAEYLTRCAGRKIGDRASSQACCPTPLACYV